MNWDMKSLAQVLRESQEVPRGRMAIVTHTLYARTGDPERIVKGPRESVEVPAGSIVMILDVHEDRWKNKKAIVFWDERKIVFPTLDYLCMVNPENKFDNKAFAITGTLSRQREFYKSLIKFKGGAWKNSVSRQTDYLIIAKSRRITETTKYKKAVRLGIKIISEEELEELLYK